MYTCESSCGSCVLTNAVRGAEALRLRVHKHASKQTHTHTYTQTTVEGAVLSEDEDEESRVAEIVGLLKDEGMSVSALRDCMPAKLPLCTPLLYYARHKSSRVLLPM